jgi:ribosomal protein L29
VNDYITCAAAGELLKQTEIAKTRKILARVAAGAYYEIRFPDAAGVGKSGVWLGEYFRKIVDGARSFDDPALDKGFSARRVLFHEFTHELQNANLRRKYNGEKFRQYKQSVARMKRKGYFSGLQEIAASLAEQHIWRVYKNEPKSLDFNGHYYAPEIAKGLTFLKGVPMVIADFIRATTFDPDKFETFGDGFAQFISTVDDAILNKH